MARRQVGYRDKRVIKYRAIVKIRGQDIYLGKFDTREEAEAKEQEYREKRNQKAS